MELHSRPVRHETLEFQNIFDDLIRDDRDSITYPDDIHTPSYAGSYQESPLLHSQFPQSPVSSLSSFSRSRSPSISSYESNINDNDDYGFSNLNFEQSQSQNQVQAHPHQLQPTLQIPDEIPDVNLIEATPIAKTPTQVEYEVKGQAFRFPTPSRPRAHSDSLPTFNPSANFVQPSDTYSPHTQPQKLQSHSGRAMGHRRCRSGGREGAGTPNYGVRLKPDYKVDQDDSAGGVSGLDDLDLSWLQNQQQQLPPQHPQRSPFSSSSNLFENVTHTSFDYNNSASNPTNPNNPYMQPQSYNTSSSSLYSSPPNAYSNAHANANANVDAQPDFNSLDYPAALSNDYNDYMDMFPPNVNVIPPPPLVNIDSIHSSPQTTQHELSTTSGNGGAASPNSLPTLILPTDSNTTDHAIDDPTPTATNHAASAARGGTLNNMPILTTNPTTARTRIASSSRRKQPIDGKAPKVFVCEVPGCGSSFTRHFNLKGHMRSHTNERPFVCSFDGCGRAFARQHDRKRHEALHNDDRPFKCLGCDKKFARIDGLVRHHKSENGRECSSKHAQTDDSTAHHLTSISSSSASTSNSDSVDGSGSGVLM
ncbi:hypothetical protein E3P99_00935 [Wallemia hederae]|uniref:C2H2-type domain-containing protein n=1 Tax=Wallemia hederae TaxID=1540922 RepID=A0A4T0FTC7_9BASI|nr:hypothetical protein E3P99_00935 [Wallemia hederae]